MKKSIAVIITVLCFLGLPGCTGKESLPDSSSAVEENTQTAYSQAKDWSEQEIISMFTNIKEPNWDMVDCVLIPDFASDRVGAVLFRDNNKETINVAFFDAGGYCQQCGVYAKLSPEPDFTYLGNGTVTFKPEAEDGTIYNYTITISIDGSSVNFKAEDDLKI